MCHNQCHNQIDLQAALFGNDMYQEASLSLSLVWMAPTSAAVRQLKTVAARTLQTLTVDSMARRHQGM
jgi:hypothetical protein